jgi:3-hydroxybutyryl-CoA dehydratase
MTQRVSSPADLAEGDRPRPRSFGPVTQTDVVRFAGAGGDFNPLHHDVETASAAGFSRPIAMGQFTAGLLAAWVSDTFGVENLRSLEIRFASPVSLGDTIDLGGTVREITEHAGERRVSLDLEASCNGQTRVSGRACVDLD